MSESELHDARLILYLLYGLYGPLILLYLLTLLRSFTRSDLTYVNVLLTLFIVSQACYILCRYFFVQALSTDLDSYFNISSVLGGAYMMCFCLGLWSFS